MKTLLSQSLTGNDIQEAKHQLPLPQLMEKCGLGEHAKQSARCPFHEDGNKSFSVYEAAGDLGWRFKCHAGCGGGDEITFLELHERLSNKDATKRFLDMSGVRNGRTAGGQRPSFHFPSVADGRTDNGKPAVAVKPFNWQACVDAFTLEYVAKLAEWRGYSLAFCQWLKAQSLIGLHEKNFALPVHGEDGSVTGTHYRLEADGSWRFEPRGNRVRPLIIGDLSTARTVHVFESQWDAFAICDKLAMHSTAGVAVIITRGAENGGLVAGLIPAGVEVFAWSQNDPDDKRHAKTGKTPAEKWLATVAEKAGARVRSVTTPAAHKDANDWTRAGATAGDLVAAMQAACVTAEVPLENIAFNAEEESAKVDGDAEHPLNSYYEINRRLYLSRNHSGRWLSLEEGQLKKRLRREGFQPRANEGETLSQADQALLYIQDHRDVNYAAPLAGRVSGFYEENGSRYLVTDSPRLIPPAQGEWTVLRELLTNLFVRNEPTHGERQWHTVLTWLKGSVQALRAGMTKEAQALALAGPPQSGKSLLQRLITHILGGRECKPFLFMSGKTPFNAELFEAEHLALEDEHMSRRLNDRLALGASIKGIVANEAHSCHRKNCTGITLRPFWRLTITLNDAPEALLVLPPLDEHVADKILLLRASRFPLPMATTTANERADFWQCLINELPAFIHFLLHEYQPPDGFTDARYVVAEWHHPSLAAALHDLSPAAALLGLIDQLEPWGAGESEWEGTAEELRAALFQNSCTQSDARRILEWPQACGNYLATLAKKNSVRVQPHRTSSARLWIICRP